MNTCLKALSSKTFVTRKATEKAWVLRQEFYFKIQKVHSSLKMIIMTRAVYLFVFVEDKDKDVRKDALS